MSQSPESSAIEKCSDTAVNLLSSGAVSLDIFGQKLVAAGFVSMDGLQDIFDEKGATATSKARKLIVIVYKQVRENGENFKSFMDILENTTALDSLLLSIKKELSSVKVTSTTSQCKYKYSYYF